MLHPARVTILKSTQSRAAIGKYVLYWMKAAQRTHYNHALAYAVEQAKKENLPLLVYFGVYENYPDANKRHFHFMLEGLKEVAINLEKKGIRFLSLIAHPPTGAVHLSKHASLLVTDRGYLDIEKEWKDTLIQKVDCPVYQVETETIVPVERASQKEEYAAHTLRKKLLPQLPDWLHPLETSSPNRDAANMDFDWLFNDLPYPMLDIRNQSVKDAISRLNLNSEAGPVASLHGGESPALDRLNKFLEQALHAYEKTQNDPAAFSTSGLSPYLHFGQISPLYAALMAYNQVKHFQHPFLEQLIVRRELAINFIHYNPHYKSLKSLPAWAQNTLSEHRQDPRPAIYSLEQMEEAATGDKYFNAAQTELLKTGKIHGYIRMYWGKSIIQWTPDPETALDYILYLNDKYALDGRDPNGYTNILWCFGKHDRAFKERPVLGKVRYMSEKALKRNGQPDKYVEVIKNLASPNHEGS